MGGRIAFLAELPGANERCGRGDILATLPPGRVHAVGLLQLLSRHILSALMERKPGRRSLRIERELEPGIDFP